MLDTGCQALGGPNLTFRDAGLNEKCSGFILESWFGAGPSADRYRETAYLPPREVDESKLISCNLFIDKRALEKVGGFDPRLFSCEENELLFRMRSKGFKLLYDSSLFVWHRRRPILKPFLREIFWYANGRGNFLKMNPKSLKERI